MDGVEDFGTQNGSCQGQNLALTGLFVPSSLDSGVGGSAIRGTSEDQPCKGFEAESRLDIRAELSPVAAKWSVTCRGTSIIRKRIHLGPYRRAMSRALWWP